MAKIQNSGQLRNFLVDMMVGVKNGDVEPDRARNITKMAAQIHESFYSEIKIAKVRIEAGQAVAELGSLPIGDK